MEKWFVGGETGGCMVLSCFDVSTEAEVDAFKEGFRAGFTCPDFVVAVDSEQDAMRHIEDYHSLFYGGLLEGMATHECQEGDPPSATVTSGNLLF